MKKVFLSTLATLFLLTNATAGVDLNLSNTEQMEKRIAALNVMLEEKEKEREAKNQIRELKLQKLDDSLREKAKLREESDNGHNAAEVYEVLEKAKPEA